MTWKTRQLEAELQESRMGKWQHARCSCGRKRWVDCKRERVAAGLDPERSWCDAAKADPATLALAAAATLGDRDAVVALWQQERARGKREDRILWAVMAVMIGGTVGTLLLWAWWHKP